MSSKVMASLSTLDNEIPLKVEASFSAFNSLTAWSGQSFGPWFQQSLSIFAVAFGGIAKNLETLGGGE